MLLGYVRVSKNDGSQSLAPQQDALLAAGVESGRIYQDLASGRSAGAGFEAPGEHRGRFARAWSRS